MLFATSRVPTLCLISFKSILEWNEINILYRVTLEKDNLMGKEKITRSYYKNSWKIMSTADIYTTHKTIDFFHFQLCNDRDVTSSLFKKLYSSCIQGQPLFLPQPFSQKVGKKIIQKSYPLSRPLMYQINKRKHIQFAFIVSKFVSKPLLFVLFAVSHKTYYSASIFEASFSSRSHFLALEVPTNKSFLRSRIKAHNVNITIHILLL